MKKTWVLGGESHASVLVGVSFDVKILTSILGCVYSEGGEGVKVSSDINVGDRTALGINYEVSESIRTTFDVDVHNGAIFTSPSGSGDHVVATTHIDIELAGATAGDWSRSVSVGSSTIGEDDLSALGGSHSTSEGWSNVICNSRIARSYLEQSWS
jgi:hypothetical protein